MPKNAQDSTPRKNRRNYMWQFVCYLLILIIYFQNRGLWGCLIGIYMYLQCVVLIFIQKSRPHGPPSSTFIGYGCLSIAIFKEFNRSWRRAGGSAHWWRMSFFKSDVLQCCWISNGPRGYPSELLAVDPPRWLGANFPVSTANARAGMVASPEQLGLGQVPGHWLRVCMYLCIYVSMYLCIYLSMYLAI